MSSQTPQLTVAAVTVVGVLGGVYCAYQVYRRYNTVKLPEEWRQVGTLKDLHIYPIKSCGPVVVSEAECSNLGLKDGWLRDRVLMVVDDKYNFITGRKHPILLTVRPTLKNSVLTLTHSDMEPLKIDLAEVVALQKPQTAQVWSIEVPVVDCGWEASEWFSRLIDNTACTYRLVYYASEKGRKLTIRNHFYRLTKEDTGAFPDEISYHLINEASVADLNVRLDGMPCSARHFRPNFVLTGAKAYEEDTWKFIKIGENVFEVTMPCVRCVMTTLAPETGERNPKILETLRGYRQVEDPVDHEIVGTSPRMGIQLALRSGPGGKVSLNDPIYVA